MTRDPGEEVVALYDDAGQVCGSAPRSVVRRHNLRHGATGVVVRDTAGRVYVHRRTDSKDVYPGLYDFAAGGMVLAGERPEAAARRELAEELGITDVPLEPLGQVGYADDQTRYLAFLYQVRWTGPVRHQASEVAWGGWLTPAEVVRRIDGPGERWPFVPDTVGCAGDWLRAQR